MKRIQAIAVAAAALSTLALGGANKTVAASMTTATLKQYVAREAVAYGINPALAECIVTHESQWIPDKTGPERIGASEGLWQIYLRVWKGITKKQADDPVWSTNWALTQIADGHVGWWSTYSAKPYYCRDIPVR